MSRFSRNRSPTSATHFSIRTMSAAHFMESNTRGPRTRLEPWASLIFARRDCMTKAPWFSAPRRFCASLAASDFSHPNETSSSEMWLKVSFSFNAITTRLWKPAFDLCPRFSSGMTAFAAESTAAHAAVSAPPRSPSRRRVAALMRSSRTASGSSVSSLRSGNSMGTSFPDPNCQPRR